MIEKITDGFGDCHICGDKWGFNECRICKKYTCYKCSFSDPLLVDDKFSERPLICCKSCWESGETYRTKLKKIFDKSNEEEDRYDCDIENIIIEWKEACK